MVGHLSLPLAVTAIDHRGFYICQKITGVPLHEGITTIGEQAFFMNRALAYFDGGLPESIREIHKSAFTECPLVGQLTFPRGISLIGSSAFKETKLTEVRVPVGCSYTEDGGGRSFPAGCTVIRYDAAEENEIT